VGPVRRFITALIGTRTEVPEDVAAKYPELLAARYRVGGLPVRVGGWALGTRSVAAITLWRTVFIATGEPLDAALLLHELRHVHQFLAHASFPIAYLWESARYGYRRNRFEADARAFAAARLRDTGPGPRPGEA
jgi:hypothetical protein